MGHPDCIIIYTPGDGQAHMVGAHKRRKGDWYYSKWVIIPEKGLDDFLKERLKDGFTTVDVRKEAEKANPGMGKATPMIAYKDISPMTALNVAANLHQAILDSQVEE